MTLRDLHPNTIRLMKLEDEAIELGWNKIFRGRCFCEEVAKKSGELGNDHPSDKALEIAEEMLEDLKKRVEKLRKWRVS